MHAVVFEVAIKPGIDPTVANAELDKMIGQVKTLPGFIRGIWTTDGTTGLSFQLYADEDVARQLVDNATVPPGSAVEFRSARMFAVIRDTAAPA
jgi:hypothetical protein